MLIFTEIHLFMFKIIPFNNSKIFSVLLLLFFIFTFNGFSQTLNDSNLPIVLITTDTDSNTNLPLEILDDPRVLANMKIIYRKDGSRNFITDGNTPEHLNYNGRINIEIRGSSSQSLPKKPYGLTTLKDDNTSNNNVSLLGMPSENDWILNSLAFDPSLIRDYISYNLSRQMGNYAPRTVYCEVVINGEYAGLYMLQEKIKSDSNRVNVLKISNTDTTFPNVTGGYITKADKTTGGDPVAFTMSSYSWETSFIHDLPKPENVTQEQNDYIFSVFTALKFAARNNNLNLETGITSIIDVPTFVDFTLSNELASNPDAYQFSTYFHKDRNGKLRAGPIWDFNLTYGNDLFEWGYDRSKYDVWQFSDGENDGPKFWTDLFNNDTYKCYLSRRWNELIQEGKPMNYNSLITLIDNTITNISEASVREEEKWGRVPDLSLEITNLKSWLSQRIAWMTTNLGAYSNCSSITTPSLVITKINYNPSTSTSFPVSNDQEFIEIKNTGTTNVNLTGIYIKELGISYQFPANSSIVANSSIFLASNPSVFQSKYGIEAFGQFTRNLSNSTQKLVLADGFGNIIDTVEYLDKAPWPSAADGGGSYLNLISTDLDNSLVTSWESFDNINLSTHQVNFNTDINIYPNPINSLLNIDAKENIQHIVIYDVTGKIVRAYEVYSNRVQLDLSALTKGFYFLKIDDNSGSQLKKFIKQ